MTAVRRTRCSVWGTTDHVRHTATGHGTEMSHARTDNAAAMDFAATARGSAKAGDPGGWHGDRGLWILFRTEDYELDTKLYYHQKSQRQVQLSHPRNIIPRLRSQVTLRRQWPMRWTQHPERRVMKLSQDQIRKIVRLKKLVRKHISGGDNAATQTHMRLKGELKHIWPPCPMCIPRHYVSKTCFTVSLAAHTAALCPVKQRGMGRLHSPGPRHVLSLLGVPRHWMAGTSLNPVRCSHCIAIAK